MHHGTPQDMESDPDDEVNVTLHHHTELLLLFVVDFPLACVAAAILRVCVLCGGKDASQLCGRCCRRRCHCQPPPPCALRWGWGGGGTSLKQGVYLLVCRLHPKSSGADCHRSLFSITCLPSHDMLNRLITSTP